MTSEKKPPNVPARIEADLTRDLRKVGGFFKGLLRFTEKAERVVAEATKSDGETAHERLVRDQMLKPLVVGSPPPRPIARGRDGTEVLPSCEVCGDTREVGQGRKIPCPACAKR